MIDQYNMSNDLQVLWNPYEVLYLIDTSSESINTMD